MKLTIWIAVGVICLSIWWAYDNQRENLSDAKDAIIEAQKEAQQKQLDAIDDLQRKLNEKANQEAQPVYPPELPTPSQLPFGQ